MPIDSIATRRPRKSFGIKFLEKEHSFIIKRVFALFGTIALILPLLTTCFFRDYHDYRFDIASDNSSMQNRAAFPISEAPFCQFSKYEITVYYVWIALYDVDGPGDGTGPGYTKHTIINRSADDGINIDLVNENLSDKASEAELWITDAAGTGVENIFIVIGSTVTVRGYVYHQGQLHYSVAGDFAAGDGTPEDIELPINWGGDLVEVPGDTIDEALIGNATFTTLHIAPSGQVVGHNHVTLDDAETLKIIVPVDIGATTPYIAEGDFDLGWARLLSAQLLHMLKDQRYTKNIT